MKIYFFSCHRLLLGLAALVFCPDSAFSSTAYAHLCSEHHKKAIKVCGSHEHLLGPDALSAVSLETRSRVASREGQKLKGLLDRCEKAQKECIDQCKGAVSETSTTGENMTLMLDILSDCKAGRVSELKAEIDAKISAFSEALRSSSSKGQRLSRPDPLASE